MHRDGQAAKRRKAGKTDSMGINNMQCHETLGKAAVETQNLALFTQRVGSTPTFATNPSLLKSIS